MTDPYRTLSVEERISKLADRLAAIEKRQEEKNEHDPDDCWTTKMQALAYFFASILFSLSGAFVLDLTSLHYAGWTLILVGLAFLLIAMVTASPS